MRKRQTVSVCIPAYNEQHNIENVLKQIFRQKQKGFIIKEIFVNSDGSTDRTVEIARKYEKRGVKIHDGKINRGQTYRQNEMIAQTTTDILVLINADILLADENVVHNLVRPVLKGADLSAHWAKPFPPRTFFEKILYAGFELKHFVYSKYRNGHNIYTCIGHMRALSRRFYKNVVFPKVSDGEDQYLYLACKEGGYLYKYARRVNSYFKLPETFGDYKNYAIRIFQTQKKFGNIFNEQMVKKERALPIKLQLHSCIRAFRKYPLHTLLYIIMHIVLQQWALRKPFNSNHTFKVASSTKNFSIKEYSHTIGRD